VAALIAAASDPAPPPVDRERQRAAELAIEGALAHARAGEIDAALDGLARAIELDPSSPLGPYNRGLVRLNAGDAEGALQDFTRAIALSPLEPRAWQNRAGARERLGDLRGAADDLTRVLELAPSWPDARRNRGTLRGRAGDVAGALADLDQAVRERPEDPEVWFDRALIRDMAKDAQGAIDDATRALDMGCQRRAFAYMCRGDARAALGQWEAAIRDLRQGRSLLPEEWTIGFNLALVLTRAGEHAEARAVCDERLAREPRDAQTLALRARAHLGLNDPRRALTDAEAALAAQPGFAIAHLRRGLARAALGLPGARPDLELFLAQAARDEEGRPEAEAVLARLR
jgi:tetratricopeptide (TPR) repeat protein